MVVPLILIGSFTKLAFAVAVTHRGRAWWLPGSVALFLGGVAALHPGATRTVGIGSIALGVSALAVARWLHRRV